jgi:5-hmdU DNA kinase-like protein
VERPHFRMDQLDMFWGFVFERQNIWYKRSIENRPPPWTDNSILATNRFTNVYRECDPGTKYLIDNILESSHSDKDKIFSVMVYRLIGRKDTYEDLGFQRVEAFDEGKFRQTLKDIRDEGKRSPFSGAYTVCSYSHLGSHDKIENVSQVFSTLRNGFENLYQRILHSRSAQDVYEELKSAYGFGRFLAYQVLVDLLYPLKSKSGNPLLPFSHDDWAIAGPGASRGINLLVKEGPGPSELDIMRWLRHNQATEFRRLGLEFKYRNDENGRPIELTLANIQNCLCEFYKYAKIKSGTGRARRRFSPQQYVQQALNAPAAVQGS